MGKRNIDWDYWRTFVAVFEYGTLSETARRLSISQPTVGRHIDLLEQAVGAPLFSRSRNGLAPTELAESLLGEARAMQSAAGALGRIVSRSDEQISGTVRITASEIVGTQFLLEPLRSLQRREPLLQIELALTNTQDDLINKDADIAIRLVRPRQNQLLAQKIGELELGLFAHRDYLEGRTLPQSVADLADHHLIGIDRDIERWDDVMIGGQNASDLALSFRCDSDLGQLTALNAGLGIGIYPKRLAERDRDLMAILHREFGLSFEVWLAMHEDLKQDRTVRTVRDHLAAQLADSLGGRS